MKIKILVGCALLALTMSACRKKSAAPVPVVPTAAPVATGNEAQMAASNASVLTMMLQEFEGKNGRLPKDVSELATIKTYGSVPQAPAGFKFVIEAKKKQVVAVPQ